ncbi:MAG: AAA family ATPase [Bacteroidota bacterium]
MIKSVQIKNFKSVVDLSLDLGSFNVLIGENGCGKSNILEAIGFGAAASADKLDYEFLGSRGIRVTHPDFMYSAFKKAKEKSILISFLIGNRNYVYELINENSRKWIDKNIEEIRKTGIFEKLEETKNSIKNFNGDKNEIQDLKVAFNILENKVNEFKIVINQISNNQDTSSFIIYSPEQSSLRKFEETTQIYPLGIKGEGLFQYLKELAFDKKNIKLLNEIKQNLILLDWYEDFDLPENLMQNEFSLNIKDKYLNANLQYFDQRSTNEGFLFLLFYSTLFISKTTPSFFAIDNIDASFNPKLCMQLIRNLAALAKKHNKQVILTTHNPAILDGLNLKDDSQRLFVISRNSEGHSRAERINYNENRTMKLSEVWTKGFIGGLPSNF